MTKSFDRPFKIFLAEDSRADVYLVELALQEHGITFELVTVFDGEEALKVVGAFGGGAPCPDIALIDQNMPREDGGTVMKLLRENPDCSKIPIIIMSSGETKQDRCMVEEFGAVFFRKPNNLPAFLELGALTKSLLPTRN
ncbi:MAG TPA: response regulator [Bryobacteraceae bacterium]|nr:response regulator [Bryobacteraceae bacterium]